MLITLAVPAALVAVPLLAPGAPARPAPGRTDDVPPFAPAAVAGPR